MKSHHMPKYPDLDVLDEAVSTWTLEGYRSLQNKERSPWFNCGGSAWYLPNVVLSQAETSRRMLLFPFGNSVEFASLYLEQQRPETAEEAQPRNCACTQFVLAMSNKDAPLVNVAQCW